jgi:hypothetical protein
VQSLAIVKRFVVVEYTEHRNKVETAVVIVHRASGERGEASEFRSQTDNQLNAIQRLRVKLALAIRSPEPNQVASPISLWRSRLQGGQIVMSPKHKDFPVLLTEALDCIMAHEYEMPLAAEKLRCSTSQLLKLLKIEFEALGYVNQQRFLQQQLPVNRRISVERKAVRESYSTIAKSISP